MTKVTTEQVQQELPELLLRLRRGETLLVEEQGEPVATIVPAVKWTISPTLLDRPPHPRIGFLKGRGHVPANWKELSREEIEKEFYGEE